MAPSSYFFATAAEDNFPGQLVTRTPRVAKAVLSFSPIFRKIFREKKGSKKREENWYEKVKTI